VSPTKKGAPPPPAAFSVKRSQAPTDQAIRRTTEELPVRLSDDEFAERAKRLGQIEEDLQLHQIKAKAVRKELKERESQLKFERSQLAKVMRAREEPQEVEVCTFHADRRGQVRDVRMDTGEVVRTRPGTPEELQGQLPLAGEEPTP
jgi:hypothetical protein